MGRACVEHYRLLKRQCVFSHDELVCRMASLSAGTLDLTMSVMVYQDMVAMVEEERKLRKQLLDAVCMFFSCKPCVSVCLMWLFLSHNVILLCSDSDTSYSVYAFKRERAFFTRVCQYQK